MSLRHSSRKTLSMQRIFVGLLALGLVVLYVVYTYSNEDLRIISQQLEEMVDSQEGKLGCKQPNLHIFSPEIMKFAKYVAPIDCSEAMTNWVTCKNFECHISPDIIWQKGHIECSFTDILRLADSTFTEGGTTKTDSMYRMEASDVVKIEWQSLEESWTGVLTSTQYDQSIWDRTGWEYTYDDSLKMNILMFAIDSISRNTMIRKLPKTYKYLTENLGALILEGYNIVGDGTTQALTPMLTGKTKQELPETRKRFEVANFVNVYPFVWNDFRKSGYVTGYLEEMPKFGTFTRLLRGFNSQPTDHYGRTYYLAAAEFFNNSSERCAGSTPQHKVMLDFVQNIPKERGCAQAFIQPHWCACLDWEPVDLTNMIVDRLAGTFAETLNNYTSIVGKLCKQLTVGSVFWVNKLTPNDDLINFKNSKDKDLFIPDFTGTTNISSILYQIKLKLTPGGGIFEATLTHHLSQDTISMKEEDISRVNAYGTQPWCIVATHPHLSKFCYCSKQN